MLVPTEPKLYHIVHVDRLPSIVTDGCLWSDAEMASRSAVGPTIGMNHIKKRRLEELTLDNHPGLHVGDCVPFYFCPRSVMLYVIHRRDHPELVYKGGQASIVHLEVDLRRVVDWAEDSGLRWAFTTSNAGSYHFDDYADLALLNKLDWDAVKARKWSGPGVNPSVRDRKQAEFLVERSVPWALIERIGVQNRDVQRRVLETIQGVGHRPPVEVKGVWYY